MHESVVHPNQIPLHLSLRRFSHPLPKPPQAPNPLSSFRLRSSMNDSPVTTNDSLSPWLEARRLELGSPCSLKETLMEKVNGGKNMPAKRSQRKGFGTNSLQISEYDASALVGGIVEKGFSEGSKKIPLAPPPAPRPTILPFPVARHRSHGPHWAPRSENRGGVGEDEDEEEEEDLIGFGPLAAAFANPVQRKEKKGLDFSQLKELMTSDNSSLTQKKKEDKSLVVKKANEVTEKLDKRISPIGTTMHVLPQKMPPDDTSQVQDVFMEEMDSGSVDEVSQDVIVETREETIGDMEPGLPEVSKRQRQVDTGKQNMSSKSITSSSTPSNMGNEQDFRGIDAENRARLERMSADEIAEAQAEILEKMSPAVIEALRKRGQNKLKKHTGSVSDMAAKGEVDMQDGEKVIKEPKGSFSENGTSHTLTTAASTVTRQGQGYNGLQKLSTTNCNLWDSWSERVEAVRELRFSLDGNIVETDFVQLTKAGDISTQSGYTADNVSERDLLRTEGDPAAAGYTIKEAIALTRSVIPGQRALALHLLASVLDKALNNVCENQVCYYVKVANINNRLIDWAAIWAYALGPEPEIALSLRMSLDDNHNSVVLACAKVIQGILSFDSNERFFDISEKTTSCLKDMCTAPIFRSRPDIDVGFLQGGYWKYNAKPSNILPFGEDMDNDKNEDEHTIQDDVVVAGQDVVAGLVRMGILPRILYLLETDPSDALEECLISILVAIARHSPTGANAIMKCQRLVQTVVDRFTTKELTEVNPSKIKSVTLLKVLARSEKKNCVEFIRNGVFRSATWHLYQYASPLDQWINMGRENCKLSSALMVEQLRFWKICIQYGYCVANFSDFFPALCMWLNVPTFEQLIEKNVLSEFAAITKEAFLVFGALTRRLPNFYSHMHASNQRSEVAAEELESWCWVHVSPIVDLAIKWTALRSNPCIYNLFDWQKGNKGGSIVQHLRLTSLLWIVSAVLYMLSGVLDRVIPEDAIGLPGGCLPWLPDFVPKIGLEIIKNGFLRFSGTKDTGYGGSFVEYLCDLRLQGEHESSVASVSCLHELVKVVVSVDKLIQLTKSVIHPPLAHGDSSSREGLILSGGIVKSSMPELQNALATFIKLINTEWQRVQSIEMFGRGGLAPGVGLGWGALGGGFWSKDVLLAQTDAGLLVSLLEVLEIVSAEDLLTVEDMNFSMQRINSAFGVCLILGPRDGSIMEKALDTLLQVPVLKYLDICIRHFITLNKDLKPFVWDYKEKDYQLISKVLASHFRNRWLTVKKKLKAPDGNSGLGKNMTKKGGVLDTIHEDLDVSNMTGPEDYCPSLAVEWAHQRLPLPMHWFLSPISTINGIKQIDPSVPSKNNEVENHTDFLEIAKAGLFFLLGIEVISSFVASDIECSFRRVPLTWKLHSLSVTLLGSMGVLEEETSRNMYEALQEIYGKLLDESWLTKSKEVIPEGKEKFSAQTGQKDSVEFLCFQSEIHESYSTFMETLVEQFAAASYGDLIYGRQVVIYLHRCIESPIRLAAWNALSNARVLELLPPLGYCFAKGEGYLEPVEVNERVLEAYLKSWVSGALDRASSRGSMAFTLVLHHLSSFIFCCSAGEQLSFRNKLVKSLLRDYSRKPQHEGMMLDFVHYQKPEQKEGSSMQMHEVDRRFKILTEACEGNSSVLRDVEKLKLSFQRKL